MSVAIRHVGALDLPCAHLLGTFLNIAIICCDSGKDVVLSLHCDLPLWRPRYIRSCDPEVTQRHSVVGESNPLKSAHCRLYISSGSRYACLF